MARRKTFYIIDGHSQIFRAYYAPAAFRNRGKGLGATFIFTRMLLKLIQKGKPDALVCALDTSGPTFRNELYSEYKANRGPMPEDLAEQMPIIEEVIKAFDIPIVKDGGYEADDCIGTLAQHAQAAGYEVRIVSRDKDLKQLLTEHIKLYDTDDGSTFGPDELEIDLGFTPDRFIDYLTLTGDTSDNIPGANGVGPKKAQALLAEYGSLDAILEQAEGIKQPKMRENLIAFREQAELSRKLVTIITDMKLDISLDDAVYNEPRKEHLLPVLREHGFRSIAEELGWELSDAPESTPPKKPAAKKKASTKQKNNNQRDLFGADPDDAEEDTAPQPVATAPEDSNYDLINTSKDFKAFVKKLGKHKRIAFDTETTSLNAIEAELVGISFSWQAGEGSYIALKGPEGSKLCDVDEVVKALKPILENPKVQKVGQNLKYDILVLKKYDIDVRGTAFDTMIAAYLVDNTRQEISLDQLALELLDHDCVPITDLIGKDKKTQITMDQVPLDQVAHYASEDADIALRLAQVLEPQIKELGLSELSDNLEMPLVEVLAAMENVGIAIDIPYLEELSGDFEKRLSAIEKKCYKAAGREFKINSPKQLGEILFDELGLETAGRSKTKSGARSTAVDVLEELSEQHELPRLVLDFRHLSKLKSTYIDALPKLADKESRVHSSFRQAVSTGRLASNDPNVQNIPIRSEEGQKIRKAFVAGDSKHRLIVADYSQIELRILASLSGDKTLQQAFKDGRDIHRAVAAEVNGVDESDVDDTMRSHVKAIHFGILYGQSAFGLSKALGIPRSEAQDFINGYFERFPKVQSFIQETHTNAQDAGFVTTMLGRRRHIPGLNDRNKMRQSHALRQAFNTVVQGSAADLIKSAMLRVHRAIQDQNLSYRLLIQVHDELLLEATTDQADAAASFLKSEMESALTLDVPLLVEVGVGSNWLDAKG